MFSMVDFEKGADNFAKTLFVRWSIDLKYETLTCLNLETRLERNSNVKLFKVKKFSKALLMENSFKFGNFYWPIFIENATFEKASIFSKRWNKLKI